MDESVWDGLRDVIAFAISEEVDVEDLDDGGYRVTGTTEAANRVVEILIQRFGRVSPDA